MLRTSLLVFAGALVFAGVLLLMRGLPGGAQALALGGLIVLATVFERWRYRPNRARPGATWQATEERFLDPQTDETVQVFYDPCTGERRYVSDSGQTGAGVQGKPRA